MEIVPYDSRSVSINSQLSSTDRAKVVGRFYKITTSSCCCYSSSLTGNSIHTTSFGHSR